MSTNREDRIRARAHELWEQEGRPEGAGERHWTQAANEVDADAARPAAKPAPKKAAAKPAAAKSAAKPSIAGANAKPAPGKKPKAGK